MSESLRDRALSALSDVVDPELGLDVVSLGLVYGVHEHQGHLRVELTMTTPTCPLGEEIAAEAEARLRAVPGVQGVEVLLVFDPPWTPERMSEHARGVLGWSPRRG